MALDHAQKISEIRLIVGEEGAVFAFFSDGVLQNKLFVRSTAAIDTGDLAKLLADNPDATIDIYMDVLDQSYLQRVLPGVDRISIKRLAKQRIEKETPAEHLKYALQVGRMGTGRKDWIYTFISAAYEPPISTWVDYLMGYDNIIIGLYFLPVESASLVEMIHQYKAKDASKQSPKTGPFPAILSKICGSIYKQFLYPLKDVLRGRNSWDILMMSNKTGGVRQVAFHNERVVFARLLNNIMDPNPDVIAGNIEQELNNAMEYLRRLSLKPDDAVSVHIITSEDVKKNIRAEKIATKELNLFTPYELVEKFDLRGNVAKEQDRFAEPLLLSVLDRESHRLARLYTQAMRKAYFMYHGIQAFVKLVVLAVPVVLGIAAWSLWSDHIMNRKIAEVQQHGVLLLAQLDNLKQQKIVEESKFGQGANIEQLKEVVKVYKQLAGSSLDVVKMVMDIANTDRESTRVRSFDFSYNYAGLVYDPSAVNVTPGVVGAQNSSNVQPDKQVSLRAKILFSNKQGQYEELLAKYQAFKKAITAKLPGYRVRLGDIPNNFSLDQIPDEVVVDLSIDNIKTTQ